MHAVLRHPLQAMFRGEDDSRLQAAFPHQLEQVDTGHGGRVVGHQGEFFPLQGPETLLVEDLRTGLHRFGIGTGRDSKDQQE